MTAARAIRPRRHLAGVAVLATAALGAAVAGATASCAPRPEDVANGDDPIRALAAPVRSSRYAGPYWAAQRRLDSPVWRRAVAYCTAERAPESPNCDPVLANVRAGQGSARADSALEAIGRAARPR